MEGVTRHLVEAYPKANAGIGASLIPLKQNVVGDLQPLLLLLLGAVGFVPFEQTLSRTQVCWFFAGLLTRGVRLSGVERPRQKYTQCDCKHHLHAHRAAAQEF